MDLVAPLTRHLVAPAWARWEHSPYLRQYRELCRLQYESPQAVWTRQWVAIRRQVEHAWANSPYWRRRMSEVGLSPESIRTLDDFRRIPVLTKEDLREHAEEILVPGFDPTKLYLKKTSGSTGKSLKVWVDEDSLQFQRACTLRSDEWSGWRRGERMGLLWGNPEYLHNGWRGWLRNRLLDRARYLDTLKMDVDMMRQFSDSLRRRGVSLLMGHAHSLYLFASYLEANGGAPCRPRGIISTAMVLHDWERQTIERVFRCRVTNRYGCEETSLIASQCEQGRGLHINCDGVFVEVLRGDGTPAPLGEVGAVVVTDIANRAMPLLRYQVGDMAALSGERCPCGRGLPQLEKIAGRTADYIVTPEGKLISGISLTENFALQVPGIHQLQIVQERSDFLRFRIVRGPQFDQDGEARVRDLARARFGEEVTCQCEFVDRIPPEPSGKYRFCISHVSSALVAGQQSKAV